eukprot:1931621-Amphidinium_carterae.1
MGHCFLTFRTSILNSTVSVTWAQVTERVVSDITEMLAPKPVAKPIDSIEIRTTFKPSGTAGGQTRRKSVMS